MASKDIDLPSTDEPEATKIWVGNFPYGTTEGDLKTLFNNYSIHKIDIVNATEAGKTASALLFVEKADLAVRQMDGFSFKGRPLGVRIANKLSVDRKASHNKLDRCRSLVQQIVPMLDQVLDGCQYCGVIKTMMNELNWALREDTNVSNLSVPPNHQGHCPSGFPGVGDFSNQTFGIQRPMLGSRTRPHMQSTARGGGDMGHSW